MSTHPTLGDILDAVRGNGAATDEVARHLPECARCRESAAWVEELLAAAASGPLPAPPEDVIARSVGITRAERPTREREAPTPRWSIAQLLRDSLMTPALAGVRGGPVSRRLLYEVEGAHLDLEVSPATHDAERRRLTGQLLVGETMPPDDVLAVLWQSQSVAAQASGDELGQFVLDDISPGDYQLDVWSISTGRAVRVATLSIDTADE